MRNIILTAIAATLLPTAALAEGPYVGAQIGYHDVSDDGLIAGGVNSAIFGVYAGYDIALSGPWSIGAEGNFNVGTNDIDSEYGIAGRLGFNVTEKAMLFVRGGYQEVNFDLVNISKSVAEDLLGRDLTDAEENELESVDTDGVDDTSGGALIGIGTEYAISDTMAFRVTVDTIEFDSARVAAGFTFRF